MGCLSMMLHIAFKRRSLSIYFTLSTTVGHLSLLIGPVMGRDALQGRNLLCQIQGTLLTISVLASICWFFLDCLPVVFGCGLGALISNSE